MVFLRYNLPKTKDKAYIMKNKVWKHTSFYYLSTEIHLFALILSGINIFLKKSSAKLKASPSHRTNLKYHLTTLL